MAKPFLDYSQYKEWNFCHASWVEKYVHRRRRKWMLRLRDDALAMGTLVHSGLEVWQRDHCVMIPQRTVDSVTPTVECLQEAYQMLTGYAAAYPCERWPLQFTEAPLRFPLLAERDGLAKVDHYFHLPTTDQIEDGNGGIITLSPGWWVQEYKTRSPQIDRGRWMKRWSVNMQPSFQLLALREKVGEWPQGVLVTVIDKPHTYVAQRTCKGCKGKYEMPSWLASATQVGMYGCPVCGNVQKLAPPSGESTPPFYWRMVVERSEAQLAQDRDNMCEVAGQMDSIDIGGSGEILLPYHYNREACVDAFTKRECPYLANHMADGLPTMEDEQCEDTEDYVGELESAE